MVTFHSREEQKQSYSLYFFFFSGVYEMLQRWFPYGPAKHIEPPKAQKIGTYIPYGANPDHIGGYRNTERTFANLEQKLG